MKGIGHRMRLESRMWKRDKEMVRLRQLAFAPVTTLRPGDGDVYTREHDNTVWLFHTVHWYGPFADIDTAETAAMMMVETT